MLQSSLGILERNAARACIPCLLLITGLHCGTIFGRGCIARGEHEQARSCDHQHGRGGPEHLERVACAASQAKRPRSSRVASIWAMLEPVMKNAASELAYRTAMNAGQFANALKTDKQQIAYRLS